MSNFRKLIFGTPLVKLLRSIGWKVASCCHIVHIEFINAVQLQLLDYGVRFALLLFWFLRSHFFKEFCLQDITVDMDCLRSSSEFWLVKPCLRSWFCYSFFIFSLFFQALLKLLPIICIQSLHHSELFFWQFSFTQSFFQLFHRDNFFLFFISFSFIGVFHSISGFVLFS